MREQQLKGEESEVSLEKNQFYVFKLITFYSHPLPVA